MKERRGDDKELRGGEKERGGRWVCVCGGGIFFLLFREGLVEFDVWVGSSSTETGRETTVGVRLGVVVCVDDPAAHQLTSGSNMKPHADTHSCFRPHIRPSAQRYVCAGVVVVVAVGEGVEEVRGGRKECVRGISEREREEGGRGEEERHEREMCVRAGVHERLSCTINQKF